MFDFNPIQKTTAYLRIDVSKADTSFNDETAPFLADLTNLTKEVKEVADKFSVQLNNILSTMPVDESLLQERLNASAQYFVEKLDLMLEHIADSPAYTDSKSLAKSYDEDLLNIYTQVAQKRAFIAHLKEEFTVDGYFNWRKNLTINCQSTTHGEAQLHQKPILSPWMQRLTVFANDLAREPDVPAMFSKQNLARTWQTICHNTKDFCYIWFGKLRWRSMVVIS